MTFEEVAEISDGRIFSGEQAREVGLVDELGGLEDSIRISARMAGIKGEPEIVSREEDISIIDLLLEGKFPGKMQELFPSFQIKYLLSI